MIRSYSARFNSPALHCKRRASRQLQIRLTGGEFHFTSEGNYRQRYYEELDLLIQSITSRFDYPGFIYHNLEDLILIPDVDVLMTELNKVCDFYKNDMSEA